MIPTPVDEALARLLDNVQPVDIEMVSLSHALHRVLASDIVASCTHPPAHISAMDGYAVRAEDVTTCPRQLRIIGTAPAGQPFPGRIGPGQAVRIFTGGHMPDGADSVIIQEHTDRKEQNRKEQTVEILQGARSGDFVRPRGLDFKTGDILLRAGLHLQPAHIALSAAMNHASLPVHRKIRVGVLVTGNELVRPGTKPRHGQTISSNHESIQAMIRVLGSDAIDLGIAEDTAESLETAFTRACSETLDILVTTGGASVGDHDLTLPILQRHGLRVTVRKVAMRPGKPVFFGRLDRIHILGLPGNPVSSMVCARLFLIPLIMALQGRRDYEDRPESGIVTIDLGVNDQRQDYLRAHVTRAHVTRDHDRRDHDRHFTVTPHQIQDSAMLSVMAATNALIIRPPHAPPTRAGSPVPFLWFNRR